MITQTAFVQQLVTSIPALRGLLENHLDANFQEILPYPFMGELARWVEAHALEDSASAEAVLWELDRGLAHGDAHIQNLIRAGFLETVPRGGQIRRILPALLMVEHERLIAAGLADPGSG